MQGFTLDSGACPACQTENSKHIDACHACGQALPWAGTEAARQRSVEVESQPRHRSNFERGALMIIGACLFVTGVFLWCGNVFHFYVTFGGAGYITALMGGALFKIGNLD